jgi:uncharacterized membrane protein
MIEISKWIHSTAGAFHVVMAITGLFTGAFLLLNAKGTKLHKAIGYLFSAALLIVNASALFIYDFNDGKPSVFHYLIIVSIFCLLYGLYPMFKRPFVPGRIKQHLKGMTGAALGLWAAGATEYFVRELASGLNSVQLITYSFAISVPFAVLVGWTIWYHVHRTKWGKL